MRPHRERRASSFSAIDLVELTELRARQRTFDGAYRRTALANLGYAITFLRLFDKAFHKIGIVFFILSALFFGLAYVRARRSRRGLADHSREPMTALHRQAMPTKGQEQARAFARPFVTAGSDVLTVAIIVSAVEVALLVLVLEI